MASQEEPSGGGRSDVQGVGLPPSERGASPASSKRLMAERRWATKNPSSRGPVMGYLEPEMQSLTNSSRKSAGSVEEEVAEEESDSADTSTDSEKPSDNNPTSSESESGTSSESSSRSDSGSDNENDNDYDNENDRDGLDRRHHPQVPSVLRRRDRSQLQADDNTLRVTLQHEDQAVVFEEVKEEDFLAYLPAQERKKRERRRKKGDGLDKLGRFCSTGVRAVTCSFAGSLAEEHEYVTPNVRSRVKQRLSAMDIVGVELHNAAASTDRAGLHGTDEHGNYYCYDDSGREMVEIDGEAESMLIVSPAQMKQMEEQSSNTWLGSRSHESDDAFYVDSELNEGDYDDDDDDDNADADGEEGDGILQDRGGSQFPDLGEEGGKAADPVLLRLPDSPPRGQEADAGSAHGSFAFVNGSDVPHYSIVATASQRKVLELEVEKVLIAAEFDKYCDLPSRSFIPMCVKPSVERGIGEKRRNEVGENKELHVVDAEEVDDGRRIRRNGFNVVVRAMLGSVNESVHVDPLSADQWESLCQKQSPPVDPQEGLPSQPS